MKNLGTLFGYEMKKIWKRPMTWIAVLVFSAGFVWYAPIPFYNYGRTYTFTQPDGTVLSREFTPEEQDRFMIEAPRLLSGQPIDEEFFAKAEENIPARLEDLEKVREIEEQRDGYFFLVDPTYYGAYRMLGGQNRYLHRLEWFKADVEANNNGYLTEEEIAYWTELEEQIQQPFIYEPTDAPNRLFDVLGTMGIFIPVLVALCVCDLFSQEQRARTYPQIFSSRQGCSCLYLAKILAGSATSVLAAAIGIGAVIAASLIRYGPWGWGAAIQLCQYVSSCSFPITARQGILVLTALLLVYALLCGAVISLVSMWSGSGVGGVGRGTAAGPAANVDSGDDGVCGASAARYAGISAHSPGQRQCADREEAGAFLRADAQLHSGRNSSVSGCDRAAGGAVLAGLAAEGRQRHMKRGLA